MLFDKLDDTNRGFTGMGGQLNIWNDELKKYVLFLPLETLPSVVGSVNTVDHDVTTSNTIGKIKGKMSIDDKDLYSADVVMLKGVGPKFGYLLNKLNIFSESKMNF